MICIKDNNKIEFEGNYQLVSEKAANRPHLCAQMVKIILICFQKGEINWVFRGYLMGQKVAEWLWAAWDMVIENVPANLHVCKVNLTTYPLQG